MALTKKEQDAIIVSKAMKAASKRRTATKVIVAVLIAALFISGSAWGIMTFVEENSMLVSIADRREGLSLSPTADFAEPTTKINMHGPERMDAYTYTWFDSQDFLGKEGPHHGVNYICYSFYLKNVSLTQTCLYTMDAKITKDTKNVSSALRILIIESDMNCENEVESAKVYAKKRADGVSEAISYDDCIEDQTPISLNELNMRHTLLETNTAYDFLEEVYDEETGEDLGYFAMRQTGKELKYNSYRKYTIVMWLEGTDLQCVNDILGGKCSIQINFTLEEYLDVEYYGEV